MSVTESLSPPPPSNASPTPVISVLLPVFNGEATLARCLDSMLAQSYQNFELVTVDDGSSDGSLAIAKAYSRRDPRMRVLHRPHQGIVSALNAGLASCQGRFVARMDADDVAMPDRLGLQLEYMADHPSCDLVGALAEPFSETGSLGEGVTRYHHWMNALVTPEAIRANLFVESPIPHPTFMARRELYERLGGYQDPPWPEDYDFLLRAAEAGAAFGKVPRVLVCRMDRPDRLTRTDARYKRDAMFEAKAHYFARGPWLENKRGVVIGGSGTSGRRMANLLREEGVDVRCFLDNRVGPPGRKVLGLPAHGYPDEIPGSFFAAHRDAFFLSCIGQPEGRERLLRHLHREGFAQEIDYMLIM